MWHVGELMLTFEKPLVKTFSYLCDVNTLSQRLVLKIWTFMVKRKVKNAESNGETERKVKLWQKRKNNNLKYGGHHSRKP